MMAFSRMKISGHSLHRLVRSPGPKPRRSSVTQKAKAGSWACGWRCRKMTKTRLGSRLPRAAGKSRPSPSRCRRAWSWCWATRYTSPRKIFRRDFETGCCGWRRSRIRSSTRPRRCVCPLTTSHGSSPVPKNFRSTSGFPAAVWTICASFCLISRSSPSCVMSGMKGSRWT